MAKAKQEHLAGVPEPTEGTKVSFLNAIFTLEDDQVPALGEEIRVEIRGYVSHRGNEYLQDEGVRKFAKAKATSIKVL